MDGKMIKKKIKKQHTKRKIFRQQVQRELKENRSSFIVFMVLRLLVVVAAVRQLMLRNYEGFFLCCLTILLLYLPSMVQVRFNCDIPPSLEIIIFIFIFAAEILGEINAFFIRIPFWDDILHTISGFLNAAIGLSLVLMLNNRRKFQFHLSPIFVALFSFCFSMTISVLWEFYEYAFDMIFHTDMQKDTVIQAIYSTRLDPTMTNTVISISDIRETVVNGQRLNIEGYLDIGLIDTMMDLFVNMVGAIVFSIMGFFYAKSEGKEQRSIEKLMLWLKSAEKKQNEGCNECR